jgi:hypothetical protein
MAQKPLLWVEVGAHAVRNRSKCGGVGWAKSTRTRTRLELSSNLLATCLPEPSEPTPFAKQCPQPRGVRLFAEAGAAYVCFWFVTGVRAPVPFHRHLVVKQAASYRGGCVWYAGSRGCGGPALQFAFKKSHLGLCGFGRHAL